MAAPGKSELSMSDEEFARQLQQQVISIHYFPLYASN